MKRYIICSTSPYEYNRQQTVVGSPLKTLKGSRIGRSTKYGVGKEIGGEIYFHKNYVSDVVPATIWTRAQQLLNAYAPNFKYNCIRYNPKTQQISFQEAPDFDTAREPMVGKYLTIDTNTGHIKHGQSNYVWHHKWTWCRNNYKGFDVKKSWEWSKQWLSVIDEVSDGNGINRWNAQLDRYDLPHDKGE